MSGGEWQKIAIARAMLRASNLVIFDEPTAALDPIAEMKLFSYLGELSCNNTMVVISHRLGIARQCNKIIVIDDGQIVESGSHDELIERNGRNGIYKNMFILQSKWYN